MLFPPQEKTASITQMRKYPTGAWPAGNFLIGGSRLSEPVLIGLNLEALFKPVQQLLALHVLLVDQFLCHGRHGIFV